MDARKTIKIIMPEITITKHIGMDYENEVFLENFRTIGGELRQAFSNVIKLSAQAAPLDFGLIKSMVSNKESGSTYLYSFDGTKILRTKMPEFNVANTSAAFDITAGASTYPSIKLDVNNQVIFTSKGYLGRYDGTSWADNWLDLGTSDASYKRQIENFEDLTLIGNYNKIAAYSKSDGSDFASAYVDLPTGYEFASMSANKYLLIGANKNNVGQTLLWNGWSDAWLSKINYDNTIATIKAYGGHWLVFSGAYIWLTDGYSKRLLATIPVDGYDLNNDFITYDEQVKIIGDLILIGHGGSIPTRFAAGIWVYSISRKEWYYIPVKNKNNKYSKYGITIASIIFESWLNRIIFGWSGESLSSGNFLSEITGVEYSINTATYLTTPISFEKTASLKRVVVELKPNPKSYYYSLADTIDITLWALPETKPVWNYGTASASGSALNTIPVNGTSAGWNDAEVGDLVWVLQGQNGGEKRQITAITGKGTASEVWTLDSNLPTYIESGAYFNVLPAKKVQTYTLTGKTLKDTGAIEFYVKEFKGVGCRLMLEISGATYIPVQVGKITIEYE